MNNMAASACCVFGEQQTDCECPLGTQSLSTEMSPDALVSRFYLHE